MPEIDPAAKRPDLPPLSDDCESGKHAAVAFCRLQSACKSA
jgi:hypothetical protein